MSGIDGDREGEEWVGDEGEPLETEQLSLAEEDERLPWLEGSDEDEYEYDGADNSGMMKLVAMGLFALAVLVGAIWWATHRNPDPALVPGRGVWAVFWSRDPGFAPPDNTNLSAGLEFAILP